MGKEKEKEGTEAESGNNWDSGKGWKKRGERVI